MLQKSIIKALENRWAVIIGAMILAGLGMWSFTRLNVDAYPDISGVMVEIITPYAGRAAEEPNTGDHSARTGHGKHSAYRSRPLSYYFRSFAGAGRI